MALEKITTQQMDAKGVCAAPDVLSGTPAQNKAVFDRMVRELIAPAYNAAVDAMNALEETESGVKAAEEQRVSAENLRAEAETARDQAESERVTAEQQRQDAETKRQDLETGYVARSENGAKASESWAIGGTGTREGEDTNNAKYWSEQARKSAGGGVMSFNGRSGDVVPQVGDYDAEKVGAVPASEKGAANGVAELGADGKVPSSQLPQIDYIPTSEKGAKNGVATLGADGKVPAGQVDAYPKSESDTLLLQKLSGIESAEYPGCYYRMVGTAVEWFDPPLISGVEYRTTERYLGKPVYVQMWDTGSLPNATYKEVAISISNVHRIIDFGGDAYQDATHLISLPCWKYGADLYTVDNAVQLSVGPSSISIATKKNMSTFTTSHVWIKYTKTTD